MLDSVGVAGRCDKGGMPGRVADNPPNFCNSSCPLAVSNQLEKTLAAFGWGALAATKTYDLDKVVPDFGYTKPMGAPSANATFNGTSVSSDT